MTDVRADKKLKRDLIKLKDREVLKAWLLETWAAGLPELWVIHDALICARLTVEQQYRAYGTGGVRTKFRLFNVRSMRWLGNELKAFGMVAAKPEIGEPQLSVEYRRKLAQWAETIPRGNGVVALSELRHACNKFMEAVRFGVVSSKALGMYLRAHGWRTVRQSDGVWVQGVAVNLTNVNN